VPVPYWTTLYLFTCMWTLGLLLLFDYCELCFCEHGYTNISSRHCFGFFFVCVFCSTGDCLLGRCSTTWVIPPVLLSDLLGLCTVMKMIDQIAIALSVPWGLSSCFP
jgi:hypothetical protein